MLLSTVSTVFFSFNWIDEIFSVPIPGVWGHHMCMSPIKTPILLCSSFFGGSGNCWDRAEHLRGAEMTGILGEGGDNSGTGSFGRVCLDNRVMSVSNLHSSFTATSHAVSTLTLQIHTSHCGCLPSMLGGCVSGVHTVTCVFCVHTHWSVCRPAHAYFLLSQMWQQQPLTLPGWEIEMN